MNHNGQVFRLRDARPNCDGCGKPLPNEVFPTSDGKELFCGDCRRRYGCLAERFRVVQLNSGAFVADEI